MSIKDIPTDTSEQVAKMREMAVALEKRNTDLEVQVALYKADFDRIWALMPELRNTDAYFEIHEAVHEKLKNIESSTYLAAAEIVSLVSEETSCQRAADNLRRKAAGENIQ